MDYIVEDDYRVEDFEKFTYEKWYNIIKNKNILTLEGNEYKCVKDTNFIYFSKLEIFYFLRNKKLPHTLKNRINNFFNKDKNKYYFFKLCNRSPKDILENIDEYKINDDDHRTIQTEKKIKQLEILKVNNTEQIEFLLKTSKRTMEDIYLYSIYNGKSKLYLVFQEWKPNLGISKEFRCFVNNSKLVGICLFKSEYYSSRTVIPVETIKHFFDQVIPELDKLNLNKYILDLFIFDDIPDKVYILELNPFDDNADTFSFDSEVINNSNKLIVTI